MICLRHAAVNDKVLEILVDVKTRNFQELHTLFLCGVFSCRCSNFSSLLLKILSPVIKDERAGAGASGVS